MRTNRCWQCLGPVFALFVLGSFLASAHADPITIPGYTVTDLGPGTPTFSTLANGTGVLNAPTGQIYAWDPTSNTTLPSGYGTTASIPLLVGAPVNNPDTYGNPLYAFAYVQSNVMNANGVVAAVENWGVNGHFEYSEAYIVQPNSNGSWSTPIGIWSGNINESDYIPGAYANLITGVNNLNQILGSMGLNAPPYYNLSDAVLYNMNSHTLTDLTTLLGSAGFADTLPIALDDDGRILLSGTEFNINLGPVQTNLLLTPAGLSAAPLEVPAPEPGALAIGLLAIAGFACHRRFLHRHRAA
jgi:hypothetical protein